jgi:Flp pilus assembly protein TadG
MFWWGRLGRRGIAAVEFALIIPILLLLFLGTIEILTLYRTEAKLNALAFNVAQMVSIEATPVVLSTGTPENATSLNDICTGARLGLQPFPSGGLTISVASVTLEPSKQNSNTAASTPAYDAWEGDSAVTAGSCSSAGGTVILAGTGASAPLTVAKAMLMAPCDNTVVVTASLTYPGLTGLILTGRPRLTQTAYSRWRYSSPTTQLMCSASAGCTLQPGTAQQLCNANSTAVN